MIVDAGGGTIDISTYQSKGKVSGGIDMEEIAAPHCKFFYPPGRDSDSSWPQLTSMVLSLSPWQPKYIFAVSNSRPLVHAYPSLLIQNRQLSSRTLLFFRTLTTSCGVSMKRPSLGFAATRITIMSNSGLRATMTSHITFVMDNSSSRG